MLSSGSQLIKRKSADYEAKPLWRREKKINYNKSYNPIKKLKTHAANVKRDLNKNKRKLNIYFSSLTF